MKIIDILKDANSNLWRSKLRSFLTILAIFVGSFTIILNTAINAGVNDFIDKQVANMGGDGYLEIMPTEIYESAIAMMGGSGPREYTDEEDNSSASIYITDDQVKKAESIPGVKSFNALSSATADYITSDKTDKRYKLNLNAIVPGLTIDMSAGEVPDTSDNAKLEIALTEDSAKALGFDTPKDAVGQTVDLAIPSTLKCYTVLKRSECQTIVKATISGIQAPGIMSMGGDRANISLWNRINEINFAGMPKGSQHTVMAVADVEPGKLLEIQDQLKELGLSAMSVDDEVGMIRTFLDAMLIVLNIFGAIALIAAAIGIINTLFMSVQERTREIGLDKALGMSSAKVFLAFSAEAIMLGFWGSVVGITSAMIAGHLVNNIAHQTFLQDFPTFELVIFKPESMLVIVAIIMLIAFLAGTLPARKAAKKNPIDALRYE